MSGDEMVMFGLLLVGAIACVVLQMWRRKLHADRRMRRDEMVGRLAERFGDGDAFVAFARTVVPTERFIEGRTKVKVKVRPPQR